jgi:hypothetical protein
MFTALAWGFVVFTGLLLVGLGCLWVLEKKGQRRR